MTNSKKKTILEKNVTIIGIVILVVFVIGFVFGLFFFGFAGIFSILGVQYNSKWSLVIFVVCYFLLGGIIDLFFNVFNMWANNYVDNKTEKFIIQWGIGFASSLLILMIIDILMGSITIALKAKFIIALVLGILEPVFEDKEDESEVR